MTTLDRTKYLPNMNIEVIYLKWAKSAIKAII